MNGTRYLIGRPAAYRATLIVLLFSMLLPALFLSAGATEESEGPGYEVKETVLTGKKILFTGGSITEAYCERVNKRKDIRYGWVSRIGEYNRMRWITTARGGASISNSRGDNTILKQLESKQNYTYDIVLLQGGTNDAWDSVPVGKLTDGFDAASYDLSTFAGGLEATISFAKTHFPNAWIAYVITYRLPLATQGRMSDMSAYVRLIQDACAKWGLPYLDMYNDDDLNALLEVGTSTRYLSDHIHPTSEAYELLYPVVENWLISAYGAYLNPAGPGEPESQEDSSPVSAADVSAGESESPADSGVSITVAAVAAALLLAALAVFLLVRSRRSS